MVWYVDASAAVKLVVPEPESSALRAWIDASPDSFVACDLVRTELLRAVGRAAPDALVRARRVIDDLSVIVVSTAITERAGLMSPPELRSLDAIHLAAAMEWGDELRGVVTYDSRLGLAAAAHGFETVAPA